MWVQKLLTFFQQKISEYCILYIESAKTVNEMTLNELVKQTTLWTTRPRITKYFSLKSPLEIFHKKFAKWLTGYVATAGGFQETELNAQTKHCSARREKLVKIRNNRWQWAGCIMVDVCLFVLRFYGPVNPMGSCRARSVYLITRLLGRLRPLSG